MKKILCSTVMVLASISSFELSFAQNADLDKANKLYNAGDYAASESYFVKGAENAPAQSQMFVAQQYVFGMFGDVDKAKAAYWYGKAANQGDTLGMKSLAVMLANGDGVAMDKKAALQWLERAKAAGDTSVDLMIAELKQHIPAATPPMPTQSSAQSVPQSTTGWEDFENEDYAAAFPKLLILADGGDAKAQGIIGMMYLYGEGVSTDYTKALKYLEAGAASMDIDAIEALGDMYGEGEGVPKDMSKARQWFTQGAMMGSEYSRNWLEVNSEETVATIASSPQNTKGLAGKVGILRSVYPFSKAQAESIENECTGLDDEMRQSGETSDLRVKLAAALSCSLNLSELLRMQKENEADFKARGSDGTLDRFNLILNLTQANGRTVTRYSKALNHGNSGNLKVDPILCGLTTHWAYVSEQSDLLGRFFDREQDTHSKIEGWAKEWCDLVPGPVLDEFETIYTFVTNTHKNNPGMFDPGVAKVLANLAAAGHAPSQSYLDKN